MQNVDTVQFQIERFLFELSRCVSDLQGFYRHLSVDDRQLAELSLIKLETLISCSNHYNRHPLLALV